MTGLRRLAGAGAALGLLCVHMARAAPADATSALFFDPSVPVHATPVEAGSVMARGLLLKAGKSEWVVYDADLLRPAMWFHAAETQEPLTLESMAQASWRVPTKKAGVKWSKPNAPGVLLAGALPGIGKSPEALLKDPRPEIPGDVGRGSLEASGRKFLGYRIAGDAGVLTSTCDGLRIDEWFVAQREGEQASLTRHLRIGAGEALYFTVAAGEAKPADVHAQRIEVNGMQVSTQQPGLHFEARDGQCIARIEASTKERRVAITYAVGGASPSAVLSEVPAITAAKWPERIAVSLQANIQSGPGWALDSIPLPSANPWRRRMRPVDFAFLSPERAAVVTFEGDVWMLEMQGNQAQWRRVAGGLSEPMSIAAVKDGLQVFTRNGLVRLRDANGDGELETYETFCSLMKQTTSTRGYPLDMRVNAAGETFCSIGGITTSTKGITAVGSSNPHSGAILKVSADGEKIETISRRAREPFFDVDPVDGHIVMTEQQGNFVPSSGVFPVVPGADFGYGDQAPPQLALPFVWIPHEEDNSSGSPLWVRRSAFKEWEGGILDLSYGSGRLYLARHGDDWPSTQGAVIPLGIDTKLPVLHGHVHPQDGSVWLAGFRIYDSSAPALEGMARLRRTDEALAVSVDARPVKDGILLSFAAPLDPASVKPEAVFAKEWQYQRSATYGSPRLKRDGVPGVEGVATGAAVLSKDGKSVFVHIPRQQPTMQLQIDHDFVFQGGKPAKGSVYFTVNKPAVFDWAGFGTTPPVLDAALAKVREAKTSGTASADAGKELATRYGCIACHSTNGALIGHSGPTWKGLYGSKREFKDGTSLDPADEAYLRESILQPAKHIVKGYELGMGSYQGVLSNTEIDSVILFIKSLK